MGCGVGDPPNSKKFFKKIIIIIAHPLIHFSQIKCQGFVDRSLHAFSAWSVSKFSPCLLKIFQIFLLGLWEVGKNAYDSEKQDQRQPSYL